MDVKTGNVIEIDKNGRDEIYYLDRKAEDVLLFKDIKPYLQIGRNFAAVNREDWSYKLYEYRNDIPGDYDDMFVYGIILVPSDIGIFKKLLLSKKQTKIKLTFRDGHIEIKEWNARSFTEKSDVLNNIRSKTWWREKDSLGIIKVEVTIV